MVYLTSGASDGVEVLRPSRELDGGDVERLIDRMRRTPAAAAYSTCGQ